MMRQTGIKKHPCLCFFFSKYYIIDIASEGPQDRVIYPDPEIERDVYIPPSLSFPPDIFHDTDGIGAFDDQKQFFELFNSLQQQQNAGNANANTFAAFAQFGNFDGSAGSHPLFGNPTNHESPQAPETRLQKFLNSKIHIGMLGLFTYLFISMAPFHWNVFLVFLVWEIAEIFILRQYESSSNGIVNVLFMLAGMSPTKVNVVLKWIQLLNKVLRDVALFMFFFILAHVCRAYGTGFNLVPLLDQSHVILNVPSVMDNDNTDEVFEHFDL